MKVQHSFCGACLVPRRHLASVLCLLLSVVSPFVPSIAAGYSCPEAAVSGVACESVVDPALVRSFANTYRHVGNPVDVIAGAKQQREIDYQTVASALHFSRYYHSGRTDANLGLGPGWRHSYQLGLYAVDQQHMRVQQGDGRWIDFYHINTEHNAPVYMAELESDGYLVVGKESAWHLPDGRTMRFHGSFLTQIAHSNGDKLQLKYRQQLLLSVTDQRGRAIRFEYVKPSVSLPTFEETALHVFPGHIANVTLPSGAQIYYGYDTHQNLVSVTASDEHAKRYEYAQSEFPSHLTSIIESGASTQTFRRWKYDVSGRVRRFDASPTRSMTLQYSNASNDAQLSETVVRYSGGRQERYRWQSASVEQQGRLVDLLARDCDSCEEIVFQPEPGHTQKANTVVEDYDRRKAVHEGSASTVVDDGAAVASVDESKENAFPEHHEFEPISDSYNQRTTILLDGQSYEFQIELTRLGVVLDISVGPITLSGLQDKWVDGEIERCDNEPLFRRSELGSATGKGCLEDLIYLVELAQYIDSLSSNQGVKNFDHKLRSKADSIAAQGCLVNPFRSCADLERDFELAQLSSCTYADFLQSCGSHWQVVTPESIGVSVIQFKDGSFASTLFYNTKSDEYVLGFRGTDDMGDWKDNLLQASGSPTKQYEQAIALAKELRQVLSNANLSFTGHSLGGGLATAAALSVNAQATVFNSAALHPDTALQLGLNYTESKKLVKVTTVEGDLLTEIQEPKPNKHQLIDRHRAPGVHTIISAPSAQWVNEQRDNASFLSGRNGVVLHSIAAVLETEERMLIELCNTIPERV